MKNLWKTVPPILADTFGLMDVINRTDGLVLLDDSSGYRGGRMVCSNIRVEDAIGGTRQKLIDAYKKGAGEFDPKFVLICSAPAASMIGTDLDDIADEVSAISGIPASSVNISGHKTYDNGVSKAMEALAKILLKPCERIPGSVNILGENGIDRGEENSYSLIEFVSDHCEEGGMTLLTPWCLRATARQLSEASAAEINLVTTVSGIAAAKYMKKQFGIPYIAAVPFGKTWSKKVLDSLKTGIQPEAAPANENAEILIVGEQLMANSLRETLILDFNISGIKTASFFMMEKTLMQEGDKRLKGEDDLNALIKGGSYKVIFGDEAIRALIPSDVKFIPIPCGAFISHSDEPGPNMCGNALNAWLNCVL